MAVLNLSDLKHLSPEDRLELIAELWDSLSDSEVPLTPAQKAELDRRLAGVKVGRIDGVGWEKVKAELRQRRS